MAEYIARVDSGWELCNNRTKSYNTYNLQLITNELLNTNIMKFWQIEHGGRQNTRSPEERLCEEHFKSTYKRNESGRFIVSLPTKNDQLQKLGESRNIAIQRLKSLEKRLERDSHLKQEYISFMRQYLQLGHMMEIQENSASWHAHPQYYLPHHSVIKESSTTTKLRVVFNASSKTNTGISLNDALMVGPVLQQDLFLILIRFRSWPIVITADVVKMYRQILVKENQTSLQRIVWREHPSEDIKTYELLTLTYGTAPASYLATGSIHELAHLEGKKFPIGALIICRDFYIDDLITGANTLEEAKIIRSQVTSLMKLGGFSLHKWASNTKEALENVSRDTEDNTTMDLDKDGTSRTLGVKWNRNGDRFQYNIKLETPALITKRSILSSISQIFDPLGLLAPILITAKIMMQTLWKPGLEWDEVLPTDLSSDWSRYSAQLKELDGLDIKRKAFDYSSNRDIQLHGFSDASEKAYGACIYARCINQNKVQIHLLCAKSRVAPIKTVSIPRLELCGAQLLAQLMKKVKDALEIKIQQTFYWTDSSIVLHWLKSANKKLPVFVAHRVGEIQDLTSITDWNHVGTKENPADLVSRGCNPKELLSSTLWWQGPAWLRNQDINIGQPLEADIADDFEYCKQDTAVTLIATP